MLSPGTPRPIVGWKDVVAGLLAPGLTHFTAFPDGSSGKNDEVLADDSCGGSSGFQALSLTPDSLLILVQEEPTTCVRLMEA